ncbi:MAG: leucine-rich repeat protein [Clostridia bacterium]|nr:leucine-rich repeat protein [Clostridia bacterium]
MNHCPNCGNDFEGNFCPQCGQALAQKQICPKCKSPLAENAKFCATCGYSLEKKPLPEWLKKGIDFFKTYWKKIAVGAVVLVALILLIAIPISIESNIYRAGKVSKINLGDSKEKVEELLGKPTDQSDYSWHYLSGKAGKLYRQMNKIGEDEENLEDFFNDLEKYDKLYTKLEQMTYAYIKVSFDSKGNVTEVFLDKKHHYDEGNDYAGEKKYLKNVKTDLTEVEVTQISINGETKTEVNTNTKFSEVVYSAKFTDGSFYRKTIGYATTELSEDAKTCTLKWQNTLGEYKVTLPTKQHTLSYSITEDGVLTSVSGNATSFSIPNNVVRIGNSAFHDCKSLTSIKIPNSVTSIGVDAFKDCNRLTAVYITDLERWCDISFGNSDSNPLCYAHNLYLNNELVTDLIIPKDVMNITYAFYGCSGFESIMVENENIKYHSVGNCLIETESKTLILGCQNSEIPSDGSVTSISFAAFYGYSNLESVTIPNSVSNIQEGAFLNCNNLMTVAEENSVYHSSGNCIIETENKTLIIGCKNSVIPSDGSVLSIGKYAFYGCSDLTNITIPNSVMSIGDWAFCDCINLTNITIPDSVISIGKGVLSGCSSLTNMTIPFLGAKANVTADDIQYPFGYIFGTRSYTGGVKMDQPYYTSNSTYVPTYYIPNSLKTVTVTGTLPSKGGFNSNQGFYMLQNITIGNSVTDIGDRVFIGCSGLTSITIPDSVTSIGNYAFAECRGLRSITFEGTKAEWNAIRKGSYWNNNTGNYTIHCTDGDIAK